MSEEEKRLVDAMEVTAVVQRVTKKEIARGAAIGATNVVDNKADLSANGEPSQSEDNKNVILSFNEHTEVCYQIYLAVKSKIDDYFLRCRLAAFDIACVTRQGNRCQDCDDRNRNQHLDERKTFGSHDIS